MELRGISVSDGLARGRIRFLESQVQLDTQFKGVDVELQNLQRSLETSKNQIRDLVEKLKSENKKSEAEIFEAHLLMMDDPEILAQVERKIAQEHVAAGVAYQSTLNEYVQIFLGLNDDYMKQRATDLKDILSRVLANLSFTKMDLDFTEDVLLFSEDLTPSQTASLDLKYVKGFITQLGGKTSHSAILARALEIPAISGVFKTDLTENSVALLDAVTGTLKINPTSQDEHIFEKQTEHYLQSKKDYVTYKNLETQTRDGHSVELAANIGTQKDLLSVQDNGAEAVGLYRTEFVFMDQKQMPSEDTQFQIYQKVFQELSPQKCIIRTLDIGGDKKLDYLQIPFEMNPFLGLRAIRLCLQQPDIFKTQIRAILRAAVDQDVWIMIPMISKIEEIQAARQIFQECEAELLQQGMAFSKSYKLGVMIEIPAAALMIDKICEHVDFISIGTNDLIQYTCAVDRLNTTVESLYDPFHPAFLRLMKTIIQGAKSQGKFVGICGSVAHKPELVPYFVGLGVDELSMTAQHILPTRKLIRDLTYSKCVNLTEAMNSAATSLEVRAILQNFSC